MTDQDIARIRAKADEMDRLRASLVAEVEEMVRVDRDLRFLKSLDGYVVDVLDEMEEVS